MKRELLIGCGSKRDKRLTMDGTTVFENLITLDYNPDHNPDIVWDMMGVDVLPAWMENEYDEIHAYEVLEHLGQQGDYQRFFKQFTAFHRALKPGGHFMATCPSRHSVWALGDPSHTRIMQKEQLVFLSQAQYEKQVGNTSMSDFRNIYKADFEVVHADDAGETFAFVLKALKG